MIRKLLFVLCLFVGFSVAYPVYAATGYVDPNGDFAAGPTYQFGKSSGSVYYSLLNAGTRQPTAPSTSNYIKFGVDEGGADGDYAQEDLSMSTLSSVSSVSQIKVWGYGNNNRDNQTFSSSDFNVDISVDGGSTWVGAGTLAFTATNSWQSITFTGTWTQSELNALVVRVQGNYSKFPGQPTEGYLYETYAEITYTVSDSTPPAIEMTAPSAAATVSGASVTISASSSDDTGVSGVQFRRTDLTAIGAEDTSAPYSVTWDSTAVSDGSHTLYATARDAAGNQATTSVAVTVDNTAPVRSAGAPSGTLALNTTSTTMSLTTDESATCKYSTASGTAYGSMTAFTNTASTSHSTTISGLTNGTSSTYYVKCADSQSNTNSSTYSITFAVAADTTGPTVSVTAPTTGATVSGTSVSITASATDDVAVSGVQFYRGTATTTIGSEDTTSTYGVTWNTTTIPDGAYTLFAVGRDSSSNYSTSTSISVTVDNTGPLISSIATGTPTTSGTTITWTTNESSDSQVLYGTTDSYGATTTLDSTMTTSHSVSLSGLSASTVYHFQVISIDAQGNSSSSADSTFTTATASSGGTTPTTSAPQTSAGGSGGTSAPRYIYTPPTPIPTSRPTITITRNLGLNAVNPQVKLLQQYLNARGFFVSTNGAGSPGKETNFFGPATRAALIRFQKANGIPATGYFGPITRGFLR